ncbi:MAG: septum site-determining protein MinC [Chitinophagales bacterium]
MGSGKTIVKQSKKGGVINIAPGESMASFKKRLIDEIEELDAVGVQVILDVGNHRVSEKEVQDIKQMLMKKGVQVNRLLSKGKNILAEEPDFDLDEEEQDNDFHRVFESGKSTEDTILIKRTLRSGQRVYYPGNIVILGDVNPGAEVIAGNNILVMGTMRGLVHAGATGTEQAVVAAFRLNPTQIRIANHITRPPEGEEYITHEPEIARIKDGRVIIEKFRV